MFFFQECSSSSQQHKSESQAVENEVSEAFWKEISHSLKVVPSFSSELHDFNPLTKLTQGHSKLISQIMYSVNQGLLVRGRKKTDNISHGCLFLPFPTSNKIILFKSISDIYTSEKRNEKQICSTKTHLIIESLIDQARELNQTIGRSENRKQSTTNQTEVSTSSMPIHFRTNPKILAFYYHSFFLFFFEEKRVKEFCDRFYMFFFNFFRINLIVGPKIRSHGAIIQTGQCSLHFNSF